MTITLAFDSFKGSLTSEEAADAFQAGLLDILPHCTINKVGIADGGEGTAEALINRRGNGAKLWCPTLSGAPSRHAMA